MKFNKVEMKVLAEMIQENIKELTSPMDDMYELGIIPSCDFFQIEDEAGVCGYFATNDKNIMLQFYMKDKKRKDISQIFEFVIKENKIKEALACTNDLLYHSLCEKISKNIVANDIMFHEDEIIDNEMPFFEINMNYPSISEIFEILGYFKNINMSGKSLEDYVTKRINQNEIILFRYKDMIIGTGEIRPSVSNKDYASLGLTVSDIYRRKGVGSFIVSSLRRLTNEKGLKAICSADSKNLASINTITKSGFVCYHKVDKITL